MDRLFDKIIQYETPEEPPLPDEPTPEPEPEGEPAPDPQAYAQIPQEEWDGTQQFLTQVAQQMQAAEQGYPEDYEQGYEQEQYQLPELDPFDPDSVQQYVSTVAAMQAQQIVQEALGPLEPLLGHMAESEGEKLARETLDGYASEMGEFDRDQAVLMAQGLLQQGYDAEYALQLAAERTREYEAAIRANEREAYQQHLETISNAPTQQAAGGAAASEVEGVPTGPKRYEIAVRRALGNSSPVHPTG
jgi:hypothetical protein